MIKIGTILESGGIKMIVVGTGVHAVLQKECYICKSREAGFLDSNPEVIKTFSFLIDDDEDLVIISEIFTEEESI